MEADSPPARLRGVDHTQIGTLPPGEEGMPRVILTRRSAIALGLFVLSVLAFLYFVLPKLAGLGQTWDRLDQGSPGWLVVAAGFELLSFAGYVALFRIVFVRAPGARRSTGTRATRSRWPASPRRVFSRPPAAAGSR